MDTAKQGLVVWMQSTLWTRWMLQQMDLLPVYSQPCIVQLDTAADGLAGVAGHLYCSDGCCSRWTCYLHVVNHLD